MWNLTFGKNIECALEAILFSLGEEVEIEKLAEALEVHEDEIKEAVKVLSKKYEKDNRGIKIIEIENSVQMCSNPEYYEGIKRVTQIKKQAGLSSAALETLSIIAYNQPVTKATVEFIRGVDCTYSVTRLVERGFIDELGRADTPGRPILYGTTVEFLRCFGLKSLDDLPPLPERETPEETEEKNTDIIDEFINEQAEENA
ncbi:MAG: SMC-Scp complex subunit ScpB [Clostridia bacterium]|nr:SMC-Scp complex subunit ScpB [Clostridia bacterium]